MRNNQVLVRSNQKPVLNAVNANDFLELFRTPRLFPKCSKVKKKKKKLQILKDLESSCSDALEVFCISTCYRLLLLLLGADLLSKAKEVLY